MSDTPAENLTRTDAEPTRRRVLQATAGALAVGAVSHGAAQSQPQASGPTVYVGCDDETLYAVDAATGSQEWAFTQPSESIQSSPTVVDGTVYVGFAGTSGADYEDSALYAVDAATGSQEWAFTQPSDFVGSSPTVVSDPVNGDSIGSRVMLGTLGHRGDRADRVMTETDGGGDDTNDETGTDGGGDDTDDETGTDGGGDDTNDETGTDGGGDDTDDETGTDGGGGDTDNQTGGDGFGVGGALVGVGGAGYLLKRRLENEEPE